MIEERYILEVEKHSYDLVFIGNKEDIAWFPFLIKSDVLAQSFSVLHFLLLTVCVLCVTSSD